MLENEHQPVELLIRIVGEAEIRRLNHQYRGKDSPTNVLAFPLDLPHGVPGRLLGDLIICAPVVRHEAQVQGKTLHAHWAHMVVHGILHLTGFDHQEPAQARAMEQRERSLLAQFGYPDPYGEILT